jgi:hypothetical protein
MTTLFKRIIRHRFKLTTGRVKNKSIQLRSNLLYSQINPLFRGVTENKRNIVWYSFEDLNKILEQ